MASVPLPRRAVHPLFLRRLANEKAPGVSGCLGELTTAQVVQLFVRPATQQHKSSLAECILEGHIPSKFALSWCSSGTIRDGDGMQQQAFGPTRYFVSHAWSYKFEALVSMLENHYAQLPGTKGGAKFLPVYYWVDILAVRQHFSGDFKDHPDSDFPGVIRCSRAVLFTMHPWRSPIAPTRVWCLFEALTAIQAPGVGFEVVVDVKDSKDTRVQTLQTISNSIEVRTAQATVSSDKTWILSRIEQGIGIAAFNNAIRKRLKEALLAAVTPNAVDAGDTQALHELLKVGGCVRPDGILDLPSHFRFGSDSDMLGVLRSMMLRDLRPRGLALAGRRRMREVVLSDAGLRGWDGAGSGLREYTESETGRMMWAWLPLSPAVCQAVAELLVTQPPGGAGGGGSSNGTSASSSCAATPNTSGGGGSSSTASGSSGGSTSSSSGGSTSRGGGGGVEELWISLRAPKPEDFRAPEPQLLACPSNSHLFNLPSAAAGPAVPPSGPGSATAARAAARAAAASPHRRRLASAAVTLTSCVTAAHVAAAAARCASGRTSVFGPAQAAAALAAAGGGASAGGASGSRALASSGALSGTSSSSASSRHSTLSLSPSPSSGSLFGTLGRGGAAAGGLGGGGSGSASAYSAYARRSVAGPLSSSPTMVPPLLRSPRTSQNGHLSSAAESLSLPSPCGGWVGGSLASPVGASGGSAGGGGGGGLMGLSQSSSLSSYMSGGGGVGSHLQLPPLPQQPAQGQGQQGKEGGSGLSPGRPALWAAVGSSRTLRMLCLHQSVLAPQDLQLLATALQSTRTLEVLQFVKCVPASGEGFSGGSGSASGGGGGGGAGRLCWELLSLVLSLPGGSSVRQLHIRTSELTYIESAEQLLPAPQQQSSCPLRRLTLAPVVLSPPAVRQLGQALAPLPQLAGLVVGPDPAPPATWMPREQHEKDLWLAHEDKVEPEMAAKRRKHLGLDDAGQAAYVANAWDFRDDLAGLPTPDRGPAVLRQRAAAISFYLALSAGWRDMAAYARQYARWAWMKKSGAEEANLAQLRKSFDTYKALVGELLEASPDVFKLKFGAAEQRRRSEKSRIQSTYWETYCS
ncbi:hypothetical protein Agub_g13332 [Astrephomene gubernaculifera]|uniref:Uncharacterized protein n=1 Tax=Astrephomene gubernaculifera TaxID=47775 RepID=A0AAD3HS81_9CHLO|nr:hypothetical protein Agub_g13332 [Astrephomene gubernaculifera]